MQAFAPPPTMGMIGHVRVVRAEFVQQLRHDLVFHSPRTGEAHGAAVRAASRSGRRGAELACSARLLYRRMSSSTWLSATNSCGAPRALPRVHPHAVHPPEHAGIEIEVRPHRVEDPRSLLHEARQYLIDVGDRKRIVRAVALTAPSVPARAPSQASRNAIAFAHEQQILGLRTSGHQHRDGLGLGKSAQIVKLAVLSVGVLDVAVAVAHRGGGQHGDRVLADHAHELPAAARELLAIHAEPEAQCSRCGVVG